MKMKEIIKIKKKEIMKKRKKKMIKMIIIYVKMKISLLKNLIK